MADEGETAPLVAEETPAETPAEEPAAEETPVAEEAPAAEEATPEEAGGDGKKEEKVAKANFVGEGDSCHFPDWVFAVAWLASVAAVVGLAVDYGFPGIQSLIDEYTDDADDDDVTSTYTAEADDATKILYIPLYTIGIVASGSICWIIIMLLCGSMLMWSFLLSIIGGSGYAAFALYTGTSSSGPTLAMPFALICLFMIMYACSIQSRIAFASATLSIACEVILEHFTLVFMALFVIAFTAGYLILWIVALLGLYTYMSDGDCDSDMCSGTTNQIIIYAVMLLCFFWTAEVLKNIVIVTTVSVVAMWWIGASSWLAVPLSFCRATTWNLGAICFGSLLIAIMTTIEFVVTFLIKQAKKAENKILEYVLMLLLCIIACIKSCMEYLTAYAFCFVGIYGHSFMKAGIEVFALLRNDMSLILQNDGLVGTVVLVGQLIMAALGCYTSYYLVDHRSRWISDIWPSGTEDNIIVAGAAIGWSLSGIIFNLITAGNKAALVLWKEKPEYLKDSHPAKYEKLDYIWTKSMGRHKAQSALDDEHADGDEEGAPTGDDEAKAEE